jgi:hypothetical protein
MMSISASERCIERRQHARFTERQSPRRARPTGGGRARETATIAPERAPTLHSGGRRAPGSLRISALLVAAPLRMLSETIQKLGPRSW